MALDPTLDKKLLNSDKKRYKMRSVYTKNNLAHIKFETKFGVHRGTFKIKRLCVNPETGRKYIYDDVEKAVENLFEKDTNKKYVESFTDEIDKIIEIK